MDKIDYSKIKEIMKEKCLIEDPIKSATELAIKRLMDFTDNELLEYSRIRKENGYDVMIDRRDSFLIDRKIQYFDNNVLILSQITKMDEGKIYLISNWRTYSEHELKSPIFNGNFISINTQKNQIIK